MTLGEIFHIVTCTIQKGLPSIAVMHPSKLASIWKDFLTPVVEGSRSSECTCEGGWMKRWAPAISNPGGSFREHSEVDLGRQKRLPHFLIMTWSLTSWFSFRERLFETLFPVCFTPLAFPQFSSSIMMFSFWNIVPKPVFTKNNPCSHYVPLIFYSKSIKVVEALSFKHKMFFNYLFYFLRL